MVSDTALYTISAVLSGILIVIKAIEWRVKRPPKPPREVYYGWVNVEDGKAISQYYIKIDGKKYKSNRHEYNKWVMKVIPNNFQKLSERQYLKN